MTKKNIIVLRKKHGRKEKSERGNSLKNYTHDRERKKKSNEINYCTTKYGRK